MKQCRKCHVELRDGINISPSQFKVSNYICKVCFRKQDKERRGRKENKDKRKEYMKMHREQNASKYKQWENNWQTKYPPGVYMIKNVITGEKYIGESSKPERRRNEHYSLHKKNGEFALPKLYNDIVKYGKDAFIWGIIEHCDNHIEREKYWIDYYQPEYND